MSSVFFIIFIMLISFGAVNFEFRTPGESFLVKEQTFYLDYPMSDVYWSCWSNSDLV